MTYEEASARWAAVTLGVDRSVILSASIDMSVSAGCPTCGPEWGIDVRVTLTEPIPGCRKGVGGDPWSISFSEDDFSSVLGGLVAAASTESPA